MNFIIWICVFIGTILFVIPGIIVGIMFSQSNYILAENPNTIAIVWNVIIVDTVPLLICKKLFKYIGK